MFGPRNILIIIFMLILKLNIFSVDTITIAVDEGVKPLMYKEREEARGLYPVLIGEIFARLDIPVIIKPLPWKRALSYADEGVMGVGGVYKTKERMEKYDFSDELFKEVIIICTLKDKRFEYSKISDLYGKKVGILRGWSYGEEFDEASSQNLIKAEEVATDEQNFMKLQSGRLDCVLVVDEVAELLLENNSQYQENIVSIKEELIVNPTYLVFSKASNHKEVLKLFNEKLSELKENGDYNFFVRKGMTN